MSLGWIGAALGLIAGLGILLAVRAAPPMRPVRLSDRIAPYLGDTPPPSRLLDRPDATSAPFAVLRRIFGPLLGESVTLLDRLVGGAASVRRRLGGLGATTSVEEFRIEQVVWGTAGTIVAALLVGAATLARDGVDPLLVVVAALAGLLLGVLGRDWYLTRQLARREQAMLSEFPVVADLLALSVVAGESPLDALQRVCRLTGGELARDLDRGLARARSGTPIVAALTELADDTTLEPLSRFLQGLVVAIERGTPLADVLRAQAVDVREAGKRALLEAGGRKEISMMVAMVSVALSGLNRNRRPTLERRAAAVQGPSLEDETMSNTATPTVVVAFRVETHRHRTVRRARLVALVVASHVSALSLGAWLMTR